MYDCSGPGKVMGWVVLLLSYVAIDQDGLLLGADVAFFLDDRGSDEAFSLDCLFFLLRFSIKTPLGTAVIACRAGPMVAS